MNILQVYQIFNPDVASGASKVVRDVSRELVKRGHSVVVCASDMKDKFTRGMSGTEIVDGIVVHKFRTVWPLFARRFKMYVTPGLLSIFSDCLHKFDVVHLHGYRSFQNMVFYPYCKRENIPYVLQAHGSLPTSMAYKAPKLVYDRLFGYSLLRGASKVIALSQMEAEQYKTMGVSDEKIVVIPNGIDLSEYPNLPSKGAFKKKFSIEDDEKILLYLGRINESKGLDLLAHAFKIVSRDLSNVRLVLVGPDDGYAATFTRLISDLGIEEKVLLTGFVDERSKLAALAESDVFVTPRFYGFPVTFLEACLARCPIVTISNELGWIHDNVGYVVENSPTALAKAISNILQDEQVHRRFRNNCRHIIKNFDISTIASRLENTYKSVVR